jgi:hypothetical protein
MLRVMLGYRRLRAVGSQRARVVEPKTVRGANSRGQTVRGTTRCESRASSHCPVGSDLQRDGVQLGAVSRRLCHSVDLRLGGHTAINIAAVPSQRPITWPR